MPSRGSGEATAVARTTVSPVVTSAAPDACLAMRPVSKTSRLPPASSTATSCFVDIHCPLFVFRLGNLGWESAEGIGSHLWSLGEDGNPTHSLKGTGFSPGIHHATNPAGFNPPGILCHICTLKRREDAPPSRPQPTASRNPRRSLDFARSTRAPGSGWNGGRDQFPVWALPVQCVLTC